LKTPTITFYLLRVEPLIDPSDQAGYLATNFTYKPLLCSLHNGGVWYLVGWV